LLRSSFRSEGKPGSASSSFARNEMDDPLVQNQVRNSKGRVRGSIQRPLNTIVSESKLSARRHNTKKKLTIRTGVRKRQVPEPMMLRPKDRERTNVTQFHK